MLHCQQAEINIKWNKMNPLKTFSLLEIKQSKIIDRSDNWNK